MSLTTLGSASTQNFDTLSNTAGSTTNNLTITGWFLTEGGGGARDNEQYAVDTGGSTTGDMYSYGAAGSTERALGQLRSGTLVPLFGACFTNNTGSTIASLDVAFTGEQWRLGTASRTDTLNFQYSTNATDLSTGTWTNVTALNFVTPDTATTGAKNGNAAAERTALASTISSLSIANGATFWIRFNDSDATGADDGLAVDDFSLTPQGSVALPNLTIDDVSQSEGNAGTTNFTFTVSLSAPAPSNVTFDIGTANNTATAPGDYTASSTSLTIPTGSSSTTFAVSVNGDTTPETNETFFVNVSNVSGANPTDSQGQGTITNDDIAPDLTIDDVTLSEGNAGTTTFTFTVSLSSPAVGAVTFDIATADNTAAAPGDYTANSVTTATIASGNSSYTFDVLVNGDTTVESNETFNVNVTNITNAIGTDTQGVGTITNDDYTPIHDIQGNGGTSPLVGNSVTTRGIVTGVKSNGFYIQDADANVDADPATSEGILVFTSSAPPAAAIVGAYVEVTGTVSEFIPSSDPLQPSLTELSSPTVTQLSTGNPIPAAIPLTATFPDPAGPSDQLERLEGMRVSVASLTASSPTLGNNTNEANATQTSNGVFFGVITGVARPSREPGIQAPDPAPSGSIPPIPRFDANPELIRVDSDALTGSTAIDLNSGAVVTGLIGPLEYTFRHYTILPEPTSPPSVSGGMTMTAVTTPGDDEFTIGSYNIERFFDTTNDPSIGEPVLTAGAFNNRLNKVSLGIRNQMKLPDILGVVEVENLSTLQSIAARISADAVAAAQPDPQYVAYLVEGNDIGGIDVGFLVKTALVDAVNPRVEVVEVVQENAGELFVNPDSSTDLLNDRPPLRLNAIVHHANGATYPVTVIVNHLRSLLGVNVEGTGSNGWSSSGERIRAKRQAQAASLANLVQARQTANPAENIVLIGDFNAYEFNDGLADTMDTIAGTPMPDNETAVAGDGTDLVNPDLTNLYNTPPAGEQYSYVFDGAMQNIDHELVNASLVSSTLARRVEHPRINTDFEAVDRNDATTPRHLSDHDPIVGFYQVQSFATADLSITKADNVDPVNAGQNYFYTITVDNSGPDPADNVSWTDTLPANTTFVSLASPGGWSCSTPAVGANGTVTCSISSLAVTSAAFTLTVAADASLAAGTVLSNTATVSSTTTDPNTADNSATETTTLTVSADVALTKTDSPDPVNAGDQLTYSITVTNNGPSNAADVSWTDTLPAGTTFVSLAQPGGWSCSTPAAGNSGTVTCSIASLTVTNAAFTLIVRPAASLAAAVVLSNTATVTASTPDPTTGNESGTATTTVATAADLQLTKVDSPDPVTAGSNLTYTLNLANPGPSDAAGITFSDTLPADTTFVSLATFADFNCTTPAVGATGTITCTKPTPLQQGTSGNFTLVVNVDPATASGTIISNTATLASTTTELNASDNSATATTTVGSGSADLSITKSDSPDPVIAGEDVTYTITVTNAGPSSATTVAMSDTLPTGTTFVSLTAPGGWSCTTPAVGTTGTVDCSIATLGVTSAAFTLVVNVDSSLLANLSNTATVTSATTDPDGTDNSITENTTVNTQGDVQVTKNDSPDPISASAGLTYTITVTNAGPSAAANVTVTDTIPANTTYLNHTPQAGWSCSTPGFGGTGTYSCSIASLAAGASAVFTVRVTVDASTPNGTVITNTATVSTTTNDPNSANDSATATTTVGAITNFTATKSVTGSFIEGGTVTYTVVLTNNMGFTQADNFGHEFTDNLPSEVTLVSANATSGTALAVVGINFVAWNGSIANGASVTITITATINAGASGTVSNQGIAHLDTDNDATNESELVTDDPSTGAASDATLFTIVGTADVSGTKTVSGTFAPNGSITYTIVLTNNGSGAQADNAGDEFIDVLPSSLTLVSASATSGTALATTATNTVTWNGSIAAGGSVTITIQATINSATPVGTTITNQGTINYDADGNGTNESTRQTDSPAAGGSSDATAFVVAAAAIAPIPTLDEWVLIALALLIAAIALKRM